MNILEKLFNGNDRERTITTEQLQRYVYHIIFYCELSSLPSHSLFSNGVPKKSCTDPMFVIHPT